MKKLIFLSFLLPVLAMGHKHVQVNFADAQHSIAQTTNVQTMLQPENYAQDGTVTLTGVPMYGTTDTNGSVTYSNLYGSSIAGFYHITAYLYPQNFSGDIWVQSTNLGLINANMIYNTFGAATIPQAGAAWTAQTSDLRYAQTTNVLTSYVQIGVLNSTSNAIVNLIPSTNGFASLTQATNIASGLIAISTNQLASTNFVNSLVSGATNQLATTNALNSYTLTSVYIAGTNSVAGVASAQLIATNNLLVTYINNQTNTANSVAIASNLLQNSKQPASSILTNLSLTGAFTNQLAADSSMIFTTNLSGSLITLKAALQTSLTNGLVTASVTNGLVTASITNGLASTAYVQGATNGFVTSAVTNGLISAISAQALTNGLASTNFVLSSITSSNANLVSLSLLASSNFATLQSVTNQIQSAGFAGTNFSLLVGQNGTSPSPSRSFLGAGVGAGCSAAGVTPSAALAAAARMRFMALPAVSSLVPPPVHPSGKMPFTFRYPAWLYFVRIVTLAPT